MNTARVSVDFPGEPFFTKQTEKEEGLLPAKFINSSSHCIWCITALDIYKPCVILVHRLNSYPTWHELLVIHLSLLQLRSRVFANAVKFKRSASLVHLQRHSREVQRKAGKWGNLEDVKFLLP